MNQLRSHRTDFYEIWYLSIFRMGILKIQVSLKLDKNNGYLCEDQYTFLFISHSVLLRMRNVSDKSCRENHTHILCQITFFKNHVVNEIMRKNKGPQLTIWCMRVANPHWMCPSVKHTLPVMLNRVMRRITTFWSTMDCICYSGPMRS